jgi:CPA2 family monovalent cation:H+ antiporter-2
VTSTSGLEIDLAPGSLFVVLLVALAAALVGGTLASGLRQSPILGFLLAGLALGPFTPGVVGPGEAIAAIAELGVIFLLFAVGVQLSLGDLLRVGRAAIGGGLLQVALTIALAGAIGRALGLGAVESFAFGAVISNSSSTVLSKVLSDRGEFESRPAQLGIAWSSVQDISTVALVPILALASPEPGGGALLLGKAALFFFGLVPLSFWLLPWLLGHVTALRNRELFSLSVITLALTMAAGASQLGVSLALGAFLAGIVVGESDLAHRILGDSIPLRDVFSGIFFVSIGMLLDPAFVARAWPLVLLAIALIVIVKGALTAVIAAWLGCTTRLSVLMGAALAQSGEFSFLLARVGLEEGALTTPVFNLVLSATVLSVLLSPAVNRAGHRLVPWLQRRRPDAARDADASPAAPFAGHAIVCGYGRVGSIVCALLERHGKAFVVVEEDLRIAASLRARGVVVLFGDAGQRHVLDRAHLATARLLILCIPERMAVRRAVEHARETNGSITVLARTHGDDDRRHLEAHGVEEAVLGETELALELGRRALERLDVEPADAERSVEQARRDLV